MGLADILARKRAEALLSKPTVAMYVALFNANPKECYINYFDSFQLLIDWLGKPVSTGQKGIIPRLLYSYEVQQIAKYLEVDAYEVWALAMSDALRSNTDWIS